jgi:sec-independent protein translocase protein TatA
MFRSFGIWELLLVLLIVLLVFGAARLPQIGEALGKAIRGFRKGFAADDDKKKEQLSASKSGTPENAEGKDQSGTNPPA